MNEYVIIFISEIDIEKMLAIASISKTGIDLSSWFNLIYISTNTHLLSRSHQSIRGKQTGHSVRCVGLSLAFSMYCLM